MRMMRAAHDNTFPLDQEEYAIFILKRFEIFDCKTFVCPEEQAN
jgi:hypothetical protein